MQHFRRVKITPAPGPTAAPQRAGSPWRSPAFVRVAVAALLCYLAFYSVRAIIPLRLVEQLGATEGFMAVYGFVKLAAAVGIAVVVARMGTRLGNRRLLVVAMLAMALEAFILATAASLYQVLFAAALGGASWTVTSIALYGLLADNTPSDSSMSSAFNQTTYAATIAGPMLGSLLAAVSGSLISVLLIGAVIRLLAGLTIGRVGASPACPRP
jgi:MFS family permease